MSAKFATILATAAAAFQPFKPGELMRDEDGNRIRAHQPHLYRLSNETLWLGASHVGSSDGTPGEINAYVSVDASLRRWRYAGVIYDCNSKPVAQDCYIARPSLLRHPTTQEWVLWAKGAGKSFQVASAARPLGPFRTAGAYNPSLFTAAGGSQSYDDGTGHAYMIFSQKPTEYPVERTRELRVRALRGSDWLARDARPSSAVTIDYHLEAYATDPRDLSRLALTAVI